MFSLSWLCRLSLNEYRYSQKRTNSTDMDAIIKGGTGESFAPISTVSKSANTSLKKEEQIASLARNLLGKESEQIAISMNGIKIEVSKEECILKSQKFERLLLSKMRESRENRIELICEGFEQENIQLFLNYLKTSEVVLSGSNVDFLFRLASEHQVTSLQEKCTAFIIENLDSENFLYAFQLSIEMSNAELLMACFLLLHNSPDIQIESLAQSPPEIQNLVKEVRNFVESLRLHDMVKIRKETLLMTLCSPLNKDFFKRIGSMSLSIPLRIELKLTPINWTYLKGYVEFFSNNPIPWLHGLSLGIDFDLTDEKLDWVLQNAPRLKHLETTSSLITRIIFAGQLESLTCNCCFELKVISLLTATEIKLSECGCLETLNVSAATNVKINFCESLTAVNFSAVTELTLHNCTKLKALKLPIATKVDIQNSPKLEILELLASAKFNVENCANLAVIKAEKALRYNVSNCKNLEKIQAPVAKGEISNCPSIL